MPKASSITALVVDDQFSIRSLVRNGLQQIGFNDIREAADGEDALRLVHDVQPAMLFLDAMMPPPDGYEVCAQVRADEGLPHQPYIVMITAAGQESDRERAFRARVDDFVTKPFSPSRLSALLREQRDQGGH